MLGVSETTVKRWVDENRLQARRTAGGHRRIAPSEVLAMVRRDNWPVSDARVLETLDVEIDLDPAALGQQLYQALRDNDGERTRELLLGAHGRGMTVADLADEVISPVLGRIGSEWAAGEIDVYHEHYGTQVCLSAVLALKAKLDTLVPAEDGPLAVGGGPEHDHYLLANLLIEMLLREAGWRVLNIGPNTPFASFERALREHQPRLLWLSCSYLADVEAFVAGYRSLYREAAQQGVRVAVGGRALGEEVRQQMTFTHHGDRLSHLSAFVASLTPTRPRR